MLIAVLASGDGWHVQDLRRAARELDYQTVTVSFKHFQSWIGSSRLDAPRPPTLSRAVGSCPSSDSATGDHLVTKGSVPEPVSGREPQFIDLTGVDRVIVRTMPAGSLEQVIFRMDVLHRVASLGIRVLNSPRAIEAAVDKYLACHRMESVGLPVPPTVGCEDADAALEAFDRLGRDVVVKPIFGSEGKGITRVTDVDMAYRVFSTLERLGAVLYLQRFVPHRGYDLRAFVLGDRVLAAMRRRHESDWRTNIARGARGEPIQLSDSEQELALRAARAVGADVAGVDLLCGLDGQTYLVEVNAVPGWRALSGVTGVDVGREVLRYLGTERE